MVWRWAAPLLFPALLVAGYLSLREGVAAVLVDGVNAHLRTWVTAGEIPDVETWQRVHGFAEQAAGWSPEDPQTQQTAGAVRLWGAAVFGSADRTVSADLLQQSLDAYRRAIRTRPWWPDGWLGLATAKHWGGQWDEEFQHALSMAWRHGEQRQDVVWGIAAVALDGMGRLAPRNKTNSYTALARAADLDATRLRRMARDQGATHRLCLALIEHGPTRRYCQSQGYRLPPPPG